MANGFCESRGIDFFVMTIDISMQRRISISSRGSVKLYI